MHRYHVLQALRAAKLSALEEGALLAGPLLILAAVVTAVAGGEPGGLARVVGLAGLAALLLCAASRAVRRYGAGTTASLPTSVARVFVRTRPSRMVTAITGVLALGLPLAAGVALVSLVDWGWLVAAGVLLLGCGGMLVTWLGETRRGEAPYSRSSAAVSELLGRLCMRADMPVPALVVASGPVAIAWTAGGRIHVTRPLLKLLDDAELEAVLAHEMAHLAHRDAAVMEICSAPSRVLLTCAGWLARRFLGAVRNEWLLLPGGDMVRMAIAIPAIFGVPPAFLIGWISRLSVLGTSRAREFSADAAAATLTGRPSALASALMKLDRQREWTPRADLRQVEAYAVLCIVGVDRSRLFSTHPPTAARVKRLRELEGRIQSGR
jgi:heat shock protein HtpX